MAEGKIKVRIVRDYWGEPNPDGSENRHVAGTKIEVSVDQAFAGIEEGMLERVKPERAPEKPASEPARK